MFCVMVVVTSHLFTCEDHLEIHEKKNEKKLIFFPSFKINTFKIISVDLTAVPLVTSAARKPHCDHKPGAEVLGF